MLRKSEERPREKARAKRMVEKENMHTEEENPGEKEQRGRAIMRKEKSDEEKKGTRRPRLADWTGEEEEKNEQQRSSGKREEIIRALCG